MSISRKLIEAAAGSSDDAVPFVEDVFSTYLHTGTNANKDIENGIDLAGKGGMVWAKCRSHTGDHGLMDTERGVAGGNLQPNDAYDAQVAPSGKDFTSFNSNGFSVGPSYTGSWNVLDRDFVSWTYRKAKNFFDVVTYTGNSVKGREIPHNLGVEPGMIIIKSSVHPGGVGNTDWCVYHNALNGGVNPEEYGIFLNKTSAASERELWNNTAPTDTKFTVNESQDVNGSGGEYVAYLFAHDDSDESMIKCGSFTTDSSGNATVSLGWEPQFILRKASESSDNWNMSDMMRGFNTSNTASLYPNTTDQEYVGPTLHVPNADGFEVTAITASTEYIYMAIRKPDTP